MKASSITSAQLFYIKLCVILMKLLPRLIIWERYTYILKKRHLHTNMLTLFFLFYRCFAKNLLKTRKIAKDLRMSFRLCNILPLKIKIQQLYLAEYMSRTASAAWAQEKHITQTGEMLVTGHLWHWKLQCKCQQTTSATHCKGPKVLKIWTSVIFILQCKNIR